MWSFIVRNILQRLVLLVIVSFMAHSIIHLAPGEPSEVDPMNPRMKPEDIAKIRAAFHLDDPLYLQYGYWIRDLFTGELKSFKDSQPVLPKIWDRFLNSLPLFILATLLVWTWAFPTGIYGAVHRGSTYDRFTIFLAYALISVPGFFLSYLVILWALVPIRIFGNKSRKFSTRSQVKMADIAKFLYETITGIRIVKALSLIHISEPTRPY